MAACLFSSLQPGTTPGKYCVSPHNAFSSFCDWLSVNSTVPSQVQEKTVTTEWGEAYSKWISLCSSFLFADALPQRAEHTVLALLRKCPQVQNLLFRL